MNLDLYAGPGGWDEAARMLGLGPTVGVEWDTAACLTRAAAGHATIRADVSAMPAEPLAGKVTGLIGSPPCTTFSGAGNRAGVAVMAILERGIADAFAGRHTRARTRREMTRALKAAGWPKPNPRPSKYAKGYKVPVRLTRAERSARIRAAVLSASQVLEPARFIAACHPEWVALEQVPEVLPLWRAYARCLRGLGYHAWCGKLNAADYGVPQTRERAILIASQSRRVRRPMPTHYDPRKGQQLWGTPWVSMAQALGWGATVRPIPTVTAGGVAQGGWEPIAKGGREALAREQDAGRWALRVDAQAHATLRSATAPAPALKFGHSAAEMQWVLRNNNNNNNACTRSLDEPAGTLFFGQRSNWAAWVAERPSPTLTTTRRSRGGMLAGRQLPEGESEAVGGHGWDGGKTGSNGTGTAVRITVQEAAILQSFPADYPWRGVKTKQFEQVGNAVPPRLAAVVLGEAAGIAWRPLVAAYYGESEAAA